MSEHPRQGLWPRFDGLFQTLKRQRDHDGNVVREAKRADPDTEAMWSAELKARRRMQAEEAREKGRPVMVNVYPEDEEPPGRFMEIYPHGSSGTYQRYETVDGYALLKNRTPTLGYVRGFDARAYPAPNPNVYNPSVNLGGPPVEQFDPIGARANANNRRGTDLTDLTREFASPSRSRSPSPSRASSRASSPPPHRQPRQGARSIRNIR